MSEVTFYLRVRKQDHFLFVVMYSIFHFMSGKATGRPQHGFMSWQVFLEVESCQELGLLSGRVVDSTFPHSTQ